MRRVVPLLLAVFTAGLVIGCGGGAKDRGKNQDADRPKATGSR